MLCAREHRPNCACAQPPRRCVAVSVPQAQRTKACRGLLKAARRVVLLTGTPAVSKPAEVHELLCGVLPSAAVKLAEFGERYCTGNRRGGGDAGKEAVLGRRGGRGRLPCGRH